MVCVVLLLLGASAAARASVVDGASAAVGASVAAGASIDQSIVRLQTDDAISLRVGAQLATLRTDGFVSFNVDFDNRPRQLQAGFYSVNFSDSRLIAAAAALAPAALRVGGGDEDKQLYAVGDYAPRSCSSDYDPWSVRNASVANCVKVTPSRYAELYGFAAKARLRLVFAFNPFYGYCCHSACLGRCGSRARAEAGKPPPPIGCPGPCRPWDSSNTEAMLQHMRDTMQVPWGVQLGNEQGNGLAPYSGAVTAQSFMRLDDLIAKIWPAGDGPIIMGPDAGCGQYLADFWSTLQKAKRTSLLRAFTYHSYSSADNAGKRVAAKNGGRGEFGLRNASVLDWYGASGFNKDSTMVALGFNTPSSQTQTWIGEMASSAGGGKPGVSDRYASLFFYVDSLSATAAANFSGFLRQDLTGASYGLVQGCARTSGGAGTSEPAASWSAYNKRYGWVPAVGTCTPNPDYWGGLLWHRLMGSKGQRVMNVSAAFATGADVTLRAYGHCGNASASGDLTLVLINLLNSTNTVALPGAAGARTDYVLTPGEPTTGGWAVDQHGQRDETKTDVVLLNGQALSLTGAALPAISGAAGSGGSVALPPLAIAFVVVHKSASCASLKTDDGQGHVRHCPSADDLVVAHSIADGPGLDFARRRRRGNQGQLQLAGRLC